MSAKALLLTKTRFKVGTECPTKLFYLDAPEYGNKNADDQFLKALAEGGFQVGELAKFYHRGGVEVFERDYENSVAVTSKHLQAADVTIFEAAVRFGDLFVRVDVLRRIGDTLELIEVKAKSYDSREKNPFFTKKMQLVTKWETYLLDVAFQTYVVSQAFPAFKVTSFLMLADKSAISTVDGINQRFLIRRDSSGRSSVKVREGTVAADLGAPLLSRVNVDEAVNHIFTEKFGGLDKWKAHVESLAAIVTSKSKHPPQISTKCKQCEFRLDPSKQKSNIKNGFVECWSSVGLTAENCTEPLVFDIWNFRRAQEILATGRIFMAQVNEEDIEPVPSKTVGLSTSQRQWVQVQKVKAKESNPFVDIPGLKSEMEKWKYPVHFIDFETTMTALPFSKGRRPYEQVAFQFSHHTIDASGKIEHKSQHLHRERGTFPNFEFVRRLKRALSADDGTIFRYSHHENTVLCLIADQLLLEKDSIGDADELISWIKTVTSNPNGVESWVGKRTMIDLCDLVKKYYYSPLMNGSNSIKRVLPAILSDSLYLAAKYSKPIYGARDGVSSLNYSNWAWIQHDSTTGKVADPYKLLPPIFSEAELEAIEPMLAASEIADGGTAMMAFALLQFTEMSETESQKIQDALLKYCELDTFAMVLIFEHWKHIVDSQSKEHRVA